MYSIEQLSTITGLTTRTLRNYIKAGVLCGNKDGGSWEFSEEQTQAFVSDPTVRQSLKAKYNAVVYDFQAGYDNTPDEMCVLLDLTVDQGRAREISVFFCGEANRSDHIRFSFSYEKQIAHFILKGAEDEIMGIMSRYYKLYK